MRITLVPPNNTHYWPKGICLLAEDSMVEGIGERRMSSKWVVEVRKFVGATINDIYHNLKALLEKTPDHVILNVGTKDVVNYEGTEIADKLFQSESFIQQKHPTTNVTLLKPIMRVNTKQHENAVRDVNNKLSEIDINIIRSFQKFWAWHLKDRKLIFLCKG